MPEFSTFFLKSVYSINIKYTVKLKLAVNKFIKLLFLYFEGKLDSLQILLQTHYSHNRIFPKSIKASKMSKQWIKWKNVYKDNLKVKGMHALKHKMFYNFT